MCVCVCVCVCVCLCVCVCDGLAVCVFVCVTLAAPWGWFFWLLPLDAALDTCECVCFVCPGRTSRPACSQGAGRSAGA